MKIQELQNDLTKSYKQYAVDINKFHSNQTNKLKDKIVKDRLIAGAYTHLFSLENEKSIIKDGIKLHINHKAFKYFMAVIGDYSVKNTPEEDNLNHDIAYSDEATCLYTIKAIKNDNVVRSQD